MEHNTISSSIASLEMGERETEGGEQEHRRPRCTLHRTCLVAHADNDAEASTRHRPPAAPPDRRAFARAARVGSHAGGGDAGCAVPTLAICPSNLKDDLPQLSLTSGAHAFYRGVSPGSHVAITRRQPSCSSPPSMVGTQLCLQPPQHTALKISFPKILGGGARPTRGGGRASGGRVAVCEALWCV